MDVAQPAPRPVKRRAMRPTQKQAYFCMVFRRWG
jgi:hypothetical protein